MMIIDENRQTKKGPNKCLTVGANSEQWAMIAHKAKCPAIAYLSIAF